jgi:ribosomal protein S18 acetylase RimI-like enzyme
MATLTNLLTSSSTPGQLRPFDVRRDLAAVADLVEQCFADTLDPDGERYLEQMRAASRNPGFIHFAAAASEWSSVPLTGYVWEEDGKVVGNISLIPFALRNQRNYLIANVATHPAYRRRGIAHSLTAQAIEHARRRGAPSAWLHVRQENETAVNLYKSLNFVERARRTTWYSQTGKPVGEPSDDLTFGPRRPQFWNTQIAWLKQAYPPQLTWHLPLRLAAFRPGIGGALYRFFTTAFLAQWAVQRGNQLLGVVAWQSAQSYADILWLAAPPQADESAVHALLLYARQRLSTRRPLTIDYPAGQSDQAIRSAGFSAHQTLIWMSVEFPQMGW